MQRTYRRWTIFISLPAIVFQHKKLFVVRSWLLFLFIIPCLRIVAQDSVATRQTPVVTENHVHKDTGTVQPVKKKVPVVRKDSLGVRIAPTAGTGTGGSATIKPATTATIAASPAKDTLHADTLPQAQAVPLHQETPYEKYIQQLTTSNVFLKKNKPKRLDMNPVRPFKDLDWLVYIMAGVVLLLGIIRLSYLKYFIDLFRAFMNPTLSQRQLKDQLSQSPFPNFLLNTFFVISLALYLYLLMYRQNYIPGSNAWMVIPALIVLVALVYSVKYVMLRFCGWLFGSVELADAYIFILYLINKVLGILLVPFLVILAFCTPELAKAFLYISVFFIVILVAYRYIRSYSVVKQYLSFSRLHFFLYLCAFEVAPVLIITKVLLVWLTGGH